MDYKDQWFVSDFHFNHQYIDNFGDKHGVVEFERRNFKSIKEHDSYIESQLMKWAYKHCFTGQTLWFLGDFGKPDFFYIIKNIRNLGIEVNMIAGNHDTRWRKSSFEDVFDNVYWHPVYLSSRVILSHEPQYPLPEGVINIHGHLHGAILQDEKHYKNASIATIGYTPFSGKVIDKMLSKVPKACQRFLQEPYAHLYRFIQPKDDVVYDKKGNIDLKKSIKK